MAVREDDELVELVVYATPVELVGGEYDGAIVIPEFSLDMQALVVPRPAVLDNPCRVSCRDARETTHIDPSVVLYDGCMTCRIVCTIPV